MQIRPYQADACKRLKAAYQAFHSVCLTIPTGGGKTIVAGKIFRDAYTSPTLADHKGCKALLLVHRRELMYQSANTLKEYGLRAEDIGFLCSGEPETPWAPVQIGMIQSMNRREFLDHLKPVIVIVDEAHHIRARTWEQLFDKHFKQAKLLGMTATPTRLDGKSLGDMFEAIVIGPSISDLIAQGYLARVETITAPIGIDVSRVPITTSGEYDLDVLDEQFDIVKISDSARKIIAAIQDHGAKSVIHFAGTVRHSKALVNMMNRKGISAEHVDGDTEYDHRLKILDRFSKGSLDLISNVDLMSEGFDCPACNLVVMARRSRSKTIILQQAGRVMRPKPDGGAGYLLDLVGNLDEHGPVDRNYGWHVLSGIRHKL